MTELDQVMLNFSPASLALLNAILAIVMFSIALDLKVQDFKDALKAPKPLIAGLISQFIALPALTFLLVLVAQSAPSIALGLILVAACPGGNISNFITARAGGNVALSVSMTAFATVGAVLLTPLNIGLWGYLYEPTRGLLRETHIDPVQVAITVCFMLILPLVLGITLNTRRPDISARLHRPMQTLSMLIFAGFVIAAIAANWSVFGDLAAAVILLVITHNALALSAGNMMARLCRASEFNRRAITIETGIQNSGLGLVLIFSFFGGLGGMAIVAALWGIWHAISGIALAAWLNRTEARR
ncbi:bile acid:sodium symporter family protein [Thalassovita sp.]|uniref:bile acid:sodium symporter family protein n=1 Tax=Thalassovita sp. TaxID=1979401 RepID=UPI00288235A4|nr:bile acid:sodium symporter family protein [Thalassovita sp.]MDF1803379.1 bile acid:sodium symporter family protein [Thalassovita sp.]